LVHIHLPARVRIRGLERGFGKGVVEVFADQRRLGEHLAVMNQGRHHRLGIELDVGGVELLALEDVDIVTFPFQALLRQHQPNLGGADGRSMVVEFEHRHFLHSPFAGIMTHRGCFR